jgi:DNA-binding MarR family transcriptional regulator
MQPLDHASTELMRAVLSLGRAMRRARIEDGPGLAAVAILSTLKRLGPLPASHLAAEERLAPQSLTRVLDDLVQRGYIERERGFPDRRQVMVSATQAGLDALRRDFLARRRWLKKAMEATLTAEQQSDLLRASGLLKALADYSQP